MFGCEGAEQRLATFPRSIRAPTLAVGIAVGCHIFRVRKMRNEIFSWLELCHTIHTTPFPAHKRIQHLKSMGEMISRARPSVQAFGCHAHGLVRSSSQSEGGKPSTTALTFVTLQQDSRAPFHRSINTTPPCWKTSPKTWGPSARIATNPEP